MRKNSDPAAHADLIARLKQVRAEAIEHTRIARRLARERRRIIDQLLVSGDALLRKGAITLREESVDLHCDDRTAKRRHGILTPARWQAAKRTGASDHFPLLCRCEINRT